MTNRKQTLFEEVRESLEAKTGTKISKDSNIGIICEVIERRLTPKKKVKK